MIDFDFDEHMESITTQFEENPENPDSIDVYLRLCTARDAKPETEDLGTAELTFVSGGISQSIVGVPFKQLRKLARFINETARHYQAQRAIDL